MGVQAQGKDVLQDEAVASARLTLASRFIGEGFTKDILPTFPPHQGSNRNLDDAPK